MKHNSRKHSMIRYSAVLTALLLAVVLIGGAMHPSREANAETVPLTADPSPAIKVVQSTASGVVGISGYVETWSRSAGTTETLYSQGSGVVIAEGGYVLTNNHVIDSCSAYKVLMPDGTYVNAKLTGTDSSTDLAVLQVEERADELKPVAIGSTSSLVVGSTVIAIGNPGGEVLANTVTQGIVSALERNVSASNTSRQIKYIQHDAAINSGNSGGGLFNINGELVGINTLKYSGSAYSSVSFEGLGFAIPVDTAYPIAMDLIEYGQVLRPQMGVTVTNYDGPDEPMNGYPPASIMIYEVSEGSPAEDAGLKQYDFITEIDGVRVKTLMEMTSVLDQHVDGDTVTLTVVRYNNLTGISDGSDQNNGSGSMFGRGGRGSSGNRTAAYETLHIDVTLKVPEI